MGKAAWLILGLLIGYVVAKPPQLPKVKLKTIQVPTLAWGDTALAQQEEFTVVGSIPVESAPDQGRTKLGLAPDTDARARQLVHLGKQQGITFYLSSTYRTFEQQADLYNHRETNPYPVAPPGQSKHEIGRAFDIWVKSPPGWSQEQTLTYLGEAWEGLGGRWGGRFRDPIHFED